MDYQIRVEIIGFDQDENETQVYKNTFPDVVRLEENLRSIERAIAEAEQKAFDYAEWAADMKKDEPVEEKDL